MDKFARFIIYDMQKKHKIFKVRISLIKFYIFNLSKHLYSNSSRNNLLKI